MSRDGVQVLSILGRDYSIRVPAGEERALADAAALLQAEVDDNGNAFVMRRDLTRDEACALVKDYQARGHRQLYWASPQARD